MVAWGWEQPNSPFVWARSCPLPPPASSAHCLKAEGEGVFGGLHGPHTSSPTFRDSPTFQNNSPGEQTGTSQWAGGQAYGCCYQPRVRTSALGSGGHPHWSHTDAHQPGRLQQGIWVLRGPEPSELRGPLHRSPGTQWHSQPCGQASGPHYPEGCWTLPAGGEAGVCGLGTLQGSTGQKTRWAAGSVSWPRAPRKADWQPASPAVAAPQTAPGSWHHQECPKPPPPTKSTARVPTCLRRSWAFLVYSRGHFQAIARKPGWGGTRSGVGQPCAPTCSTHLPRAGKTAHRTWT